MHAAEREKAILEALGRTGFIAYRDLESALMASPATIRRDLARLEGEAKLKRVHGGAKLRPEDSAEPVALSLKGTPFGMSMTQNLAAKRAIGRSAAALCAPGEGVIIDGGTTTFQMCDHLAGLVLQVLTNSLHIVNALLPQERTQLLVPSGAIFREQNIILAPAEKNAMPEFHASKLFIGAAAVSTRGIFQTDAILVASQRRLLEMADEIILLADSSKFVGSSGSVVCPLDRIDHLITDVGARDEDLERLRGAGIGRITIAD